jgi:hypothetical protein
MRWLFPVNKLATYKLVQQTFAVHGGYILEKGKR